MKTTQVSPVTVGFLALFALGFMALAAPAPTHAQVAPTCDLDVVLVVDRSGSIGEDMGAVITAFEGFVDNTLVPDTEMSLVSFADGATLDQDWTASPTDMKTAIGGLSSGGGTNWQAAINTAQAQFPHRAGDPDVMIFASDGNPNVPGDALNAAIAAADTAKGAGTYIVAIGIGDGINGTNLDSISSDGSHIESDFDQLETDLGELALTLCDQVDPGDGGGVLKAKISNRNHAFVMNYTETGANTGGNEAGGSTGGEGGNGGDIENESGDQAVDTANTGNGGRGGNGGLGGTVVTGDATANGSVANTVNSNLVRINSCGCDEDSVLKVRVRNSNHAKVMNMTQTGANSGENGAGGSEGGEGGNGGDIENGDGYRGEKLQVLNEENGGGEQEVDDSTTGNGGAGGNSADGGLIQTGAATARTTVDNVVNTNRVRVR